jgi:hypothetical protein
MGTWVLRSIFSCSLAVISDLNNFQVTSDEIYFGLGCMTNLVRAPQRTKGTNGSFPNRVKLQGAKSV